MDTAQENELLSFLTPPESDAGPLAFASDDPSAAVRPVADWIVSRAHQALSVPDWRGWISLDIVLLVARKAYDLALNRLPIPVPDAIRESIWGFCDQAIRNLYESGS